MTVTTTEVFLEWLRSEHGKAGFDLHDGDAGPKLALWSRREPMTLFGAF
jgi:hypothetical protein